MAYNIIHIHTDKPTIDPAFYENLEQLAEQFGLVIKREYQTDSVQLIQEDREWLDQREEERTAHTKGLQKDLSHLDLMRRLK
jgi:hypothetical protein